MTKRCVLCIGNDPVNLNLRAALLRENGWNVITSGSGHEGVLLFEQLPCQAVILDLNDDGAQAALIASQIKREDSATSIIMIVTNPETLLPGSTDQAKAIVLKSEEHRALPERLKALLGSS
jgi:DNA-binding response OmpR family regulator